MANLSFGATSLALSFNSTSFGVHPGRTFPGVPHSSLHAEPDGRKLAAERAGAAANGADLLFEEIKQRVAGDPIKFNIVVQLAEDGDTVDDATVRWPDSRPQVRFGEISLTELVPESDAERRRYIFDPIPRVDGIEASADPLFQPRADVYLLSGRRRRAADEQKARTATV